MSDLVTSARAKQSINQAAFTSAEDAQIASLVSAASLAIERLCRRTFASTAYDEYLDQLLDLNNRFIASITSAPEMIPALHERHTMPSSCRRSERAALASASALPQQSE